MSANLNTYPSFVPEGSAHASRTPVPEDVPSILDSRFLGKLTFAGGYPTPATLARISDELDFQRACQVFLRNILAASLCAFREGLRGDLGARSAQDLVIFRFSDEEEQRKGNSGMVYAAAFLDLRKDGPTVVDVPPGVVGLFDDMWMRAVEDIGPLGPDDGQGGKYLVLPPHYAGPLPQTDFFVCRSKTYGVWLVIGAMAQTETALDHVLQMFKRTRLYPLSREAPAPPMNYIDATRRKLNFVHATDIRYFEHVAALVAEEDEQAIDSESTAMLSAIGICKGATFHPREKMRGILNEAAQAASLMAQAISFARRTEDARIFRDRRWLSGFPATSAFVEPVTPLIDEILAIGLSEVTTDQSLDSSSADFWTCHDSNGEWLRGEKNYRLCLPAPVPAREFWSIVIHDSATHLPVTNEQIFASNGHESTASLESDRTIQILFGPEAPAHESNWVRTRSGRGWFPVLRLYRPLDAWFCKTWKPGDVEPSS